MIGEDQRDNSDRGKALRMLVGEAMSEMTRLTGHDGKRIYEVSPEQLHCFMSRAWTMGRLAGKAGAWNEAQSQLKGR